jgi:hypothetical protein
MPEDIHQDRFALMTVLTRAHEARPNDYAGSEALMAMSDEHLVAHATELLRSLEETPEDDALTVEVRAALSEILGASA